MIERKKKIKLIQAGLLFVGVLLFIISYSKKEIDEKNDEILSKSTKDKIENELKKQKDTNEGDIFFNIEYSGFDLSGNRYILKSKEARTNKIDDEIILMKNVEATFYFKDNTVLLIFSELGKYNNKTLDMEFDKAVRANYENNELLAEKAEYSNSQGYLSITKNVKVNSNQGNLVADKLLFDIKKQTLDIYSFNDNKINAKLKLDEKRF